jgi:CheY-like chemotaxis protein
VELTAGNVGVALQIPEDDEAVDLLFTDVMMPGGMTGRQLAERAVLLRRRPKTLFISAYTEGAIIRQGKRDPGTHFLPKPCRRQDLVCNFRKALDGSSRGGRSRSVRGGDGPRRYN